MRLFIAENPSVATHIVKALGGHFRCQDSYFESVTDIVSCCVDPLGEWDVPDAPYLAGKAGRPDTLPVTSFRATRLARQTATLAFLLGRADLKMIVHCGIPDDQSPSQVGRMLPCAASEVPIKQVLINDCTPPAVIKAFPLC